MPEGPELLLSADYIRPLLQERTIIKAYPTNNSRYAITLPEGYVAFQNYIDQGQCQVQDVQVKGKFMFWQFSDNWSLWCTFGMSGRMSPQRDHHPCFVFQLDNSTEMVFDDTRHFGTIKFSNNPQALTAKLNELGWDALSQPLDINRRNWIKNKLFRSNKTIVEILMDQKIFCGVGNYIKCESLYVSGLSPWRLGKSLNHDDIDRLCQAIVNVVNTSYQQRGATILTYKTADGAEGDYANFFKVYGKKQDPQGLPIKKETTSDGRTTHWVPAIQI